MPTPVLPRAVNPITVSSRAGLLHALVGVAGVLTFLGTGVYLLRGFPELHGGSDAVRYQFRANHIYILLASLANWLTGIHLRAAEQRWRRLVARLGSAVMLAAPLLLVTAFFVEPKAASPDRPLTLLGVVALLAGTVAHALSAAPGPFLPRTAFRWRNK